MQFCMSTLLTIAFLLSSFASLDAHGEDSVPTAASAPQCMLSIAGVPGPAGPPGPPGPIGPRGYSGESGPIGIQGPKGSQGPKGDHGIGVTGEVGQTGRPGEKGQKGARGASVTGETGQVGRPGEKGQKGDPGEISGIPPRGLVAFTVRRSSSFSSASSSNRFPFEEFVARWGVDNFDLGTGTFTCSVPGVYFFTFAVFKPLSPNHSYAYLRKNGNIVVTAASDAAANDNTHAANSAILDLQQGDEVYLTLWGNVFDSSKHYNTFSGFLLSEA